MDPGTPGRGGGVKKTYKTQKNKEEDIFNKVQSTVRLSQAQLSNGHQERCRNFVLQKKTSRHM